MEKITKTLDMVNRYQHTKFQSFLIKNLDLVVKKRPMQSIVSPQKVKLSSVRTENQNLLWTDLNNASVFF